MLPQLQGQINALSLSQLGQQNGMMGQQSGANNNIMLGQQVNGMGGGMNGPVGQQMGLGGMNGGMNGGGMNGLGGMSGLGSMGQRPPMPSSRLSSTASASSPI